MSPKWLLAAALVFVLAVPPTSATVEGPCAMVVNGVDLAEVDPNNIQHAIKLNATDVVNYTLQAPAGVKHYQLFIHYGPVKQVIQEGNTTPSPIPVTLTGNTSLEDLAWVGSGVYRMTAQLDMIDESQCRADALLHFQPGAVLTAALITAGTATAIGGVGVLVSTVNSLRDVKEVWDTVKDIKDQARIR